MQISAWLTHVLTTSSLFAACATVTPYETDTCMLGLRSTLERGRYSGPVLCQPENAQFVAVGTVKTLNGKYAIYDYRYRHLPVGGGVWHGGQRVLVLRDGNYVGQFDLNPPPVAVITIAGTKVSMTVVSETTAFDLLQGVPTRLLVDGFVVDLFR